MGASTPKSLAPQKAPTPQTPAERRAAEAVLDGLVDRFAPEHRRTFAAMRKWVKQRLPTAHELVYEYRSWFVVSYAPGAHGYEGVVAIRGSADGVKLYVQGGKAGAANLPDPEKLLRGSGTQARWIDLDDEFPLAHPAVERVVDEAISRSATPFPAEGRGPIVVCSSSKPARPEKKAATRKAVAKKAVAKKIAGSTRKAKR